MELLEIAVNIATIAGVISGIILGILVYKKDTSGRSLATEIQHSFLFLFFKYATIVCIVILATLLTTLAFGGNSKHIRQDIREDSRITLESEMRIQESIQDYTDRVFFHWDSNAFKARMLKDAVINASKKKGYLFPFPLRDRKNINNFYISRKFIKTTNLKPSFLSQQELGYIDKYLENTKERKTIPIVLSLLNDDSFISMLMCDFELDSKSIHLTLSDKAAIIAGYINERFASLSLS